MAEILTRERRSADPSSRHQAFAAGLLAVGLLLFSWPFVRAPPLDLVSAYLHLLGSWAFVIAAISVMSRALRAREPPAGHTRGGRE